MLPGLVFMIFPGKKESTLVFFDDFCENYLEMALYPVTCYHLKQVLLEQLFKKKQDEPVFLNR